MLITGASRGIGATTAQAAARTGAQADVSQAADVKRLSAESTARFGRIDVPVDNVGFMVLGPLKDVTDESFQRPLAINVQGVFNTLCEAATQLAEGGSIVNFSSSTPG